MTVTIGRVSRAAISMARTFLATSVEVSASVTSFIELLAGCIFA